MIRGLYTSGWSMLANSKKMDVVSNNLANVNTNAYKKDTVIFESFPSVLTKRINDARSALDPLGQPGKMELGSDVGQIFTNFTQGQLVKTDNKMDMAFHNGNNAFFTVSVPDKNGGEKEYYTRDGAFSMNADKLLVTSEGYPVMGENGPVVLQDGDFKVEADGTVIQGGQILDKLLIKEFKDTTTLRKFGQNLLSRTDEAEEQDFSGTVLQGSVEQSNVNIVKEMVDMISVMRSYEASQKVLLAQDGTLDKAVNEVGSLR